MEKIYLGEHNYAVHSYHTDVNQKITLPVLFSFMQESAWEHAAINNFGFEYLKELNLFWALSRFKVIIHKYPKWKEVLQMETWSKAPDGLMAYRDFEVFNYKREKVLSASSAWLILDMDTRRPQRMAILEEKFPLIKDRMAIADPLSKLTQMECDEIVGNVTAQYSAIDVNGHVNNIKYIEWVLDSFPYEFINKYEVSQIEINYLHEMYAGEQCTIYCKEFEDMQYFAKLVRSDGKEVVKMLFSLRKRVTE